MRIQWGPVGLSVVLTIATVWIMMIYEHTRAHPPAQAAKGAGQVETAEGPTPKQRRFYDSRQADVAWNAACEAKKVDCLTIRRPALAWIPLETAYGVYHMGDGAIVMDAEIRGQPFAQYVMLHEMIHYLQHYSDGREVATTTEEACEKEREAVTLAYPYAARWGLRMDGRAVPWSVMRLRYSCGTESETGTT